MSSGLSSTPVPPHPFPSLVSDIDLFSTFRILREKYQSRASKSGLEKERKAAKKLVTEAKELFEGCEKVVKKVEERFGHRGKTESEYFDMRAKLRKRRTVVIRSREDARVLAEVVSEVKTSKVWKLKKVIIADTINTRQDIESIIEGLRIVVEVEYVDSESE